MDNTKDTINKLEKPILQAVVSLNEMKVINALRETIPFLSITIKKGVHGNIKRITIHKEMDVFLEEKI